MLLLDDLLLAPAKGLFSVFRAIHQQVQDQLQDQGHLRQELLRLQLLRNSDEAHREALESALLSALASAQRRNKR